MKKLAYILAQTPVQLLIVMLFAVAFFPHFGLSFQAGSYALSMLLKDLLMLLLPFVIYSSVCLAFAGMPRGAGVFVVLLLLCICLSNFVNVLLAGAFSHWLVDADQTFHTQSVEALIPLWHWQLPKLISNDVGLLSGFVAGLLYSLKPMPALYRATLIINRYSMLALQRGFVPLLPLFVLGFLMKLLHDDIIGQLIRQHAQLVVEMLLFLVGYLGLLLFAISGFRLPLFLIRVRTITTPALAAFTSMSSASALPFSIAAATKSTGDPKLAQMVMPTTVNIHMVGDSLCIPIIAMLIMVSMGMPLPSFEQYLAFAAFFVLAKFSGAGVPGGTILVMIPVLEKTFGFTSEMSGLITTFYILIDCFTTTGNVIGNNIFVLYMEKVYLGLQCFSLLPKVNAMETN
jgi:Na+/serine symporter